eukprot:TRINITY_DN962_c0_g1_i1.p1 TRINITY_DN962_c0_g1~~TRINITY_DN962_c0_g1_i1.p1  ORF type:complete len:106 (-),score=13.01 TRINITY_DN962_c0_g1_i1:293-610(-)
MSNESSSSYDSKFILSVPSSDVFTTICCSNPYLSNTICSAFVNFFAVNCLCSIFELSKFNDSSNFCSNNFCFSLASSSFSFITFWYFEIISFTNPSSNSSSSLII